jgi:cytochrome oxidase Cu insertion factor (SCO1/SenC/PrrC family)
MKAWAHRRASGALIVALVVSALVALPLVFSACGSDGVEAAGTQTTAAGGKAATSFSGTTLDGKTVSLDQYRGKPLLLVYMTDT